MAAAIDNKHGSCISNWLQLESVTQLVLATLHIGALPFIDATTPGELW